MSSTDDQHFLHEFGKLVLRLFRVTLACAVFCNLLDNVLVYCNGFLSASSRLLSSYCTPKSKRGFGGNSLSIAMKHASQVVFGLIIIIIFGDYEKLIREADFDK